MSQAENSSKLYKYALEECIKQFDYGNDENWRSMIEDMVIEFAQQRIDKEDILAKEHQTKQQKSDHNG